MQAGFDSWLKFEEWSVGFCDFGQSLKIGVLVG
jgi:hypothetical protein